MSIHRLTDFTPPRWLRNPHAQSMYANLIRRRSYSWQADLIRLPDGEAMSYGCHLRGAREAILLIHGLEGSYHSGYIAGMAHALHDLPVDLYAINLRGCGPERGYTRSSYHSGFTSDLHYMLSVHLSHYDAVSAIGFSLGGNIVMKYLGEDPDRVPVHFKIGLGISVPGDLSIGAPWLDRTIYKYYFLGSLKRRGLNHARREDSQLSADRIRSVRSLVDYDHVVTAPLHGFKDAWDYYEQSSCHRYIERIQHPAHILNSLDDPFFPPEGQPIAACTDHRHAHIHLTDRGGHVGFIQSRYESSYAEDWALRLLR